MNEVLWLWQEIMININREVKTKIKVCKVNLSKLVYKKEKFYIVKCSMFCHVIVFWSLIILGCAIMFCSHQVVFCCLGNLVHGVYRLQFVHFCQLYSSSHEVRITWLKLWFQSLTFFDNSTQSNQVYVNMDLSSVWSHLLIIHLPCWSFTVVLHWPTGECFSVFAFQCFALLFALHTLG